MGKLLEKMKNIFIAWSDHFLVLPDDDISEKSNCIAVVLPEGVTPDGDEASKQSKANADIAIDLFHRKIVKCLIVCGGNRASTDKDPEAILITEYMVEKDPELWLKIFEEPVSVDTISNAHWARHPLKAIMKKLQPVSGLIIIAHKKQGSRAKIIFENLVIELGFDLPVYILSADPPYGDNAQKGRFKDEFIFTFWNCIAYLMAAAKCRR